MFQGNIVAVVVPCFRVEQQVADVILGIPPCVDHIIAVNDASPDQTGQVLAGLDCPRLIVLAHQSNQGVGGAMVTGFRRAMQLDADIVVKIDGDGQMKSEYLELLLQPIADGTCDYAKGNRFLHSQELAHMPFARIFGNIILTFLTKIASGYWHIFDPQNGYLATSRTYLELLNLDKLATRRYFFENEMLIQMNVESARVLDCAMPSVYGQEKSSLKISRVLTYFPYFLCHGFFSRLFQRYILRDFSIVIPMYVIGSLFFIWGVFFGGFVWIRALKTGFPATTGTVMLAVLPLILGVQMLLQGLLFEILQTPRVFHRQPIRHDNECSSQQKVPAPHQHPPSSTDK
jgi:glycosyltransferase involved in cell wall biosynthesis